MRAQPVPFPGRWSQNISKSPWPPFRYQVSKCEKYFKWRRGRNREFGNHHQENTNTSFTFNVSTCFHKWEILHMWCRKISRLSNPFQVSGIKLLHLHHLHLRHNHRGWVCDNRSQIHQHDTSLPPRCLQMTLCCPHNTNYCHRCHHNHHPDISFFTMWALFLYCHQHQHAQLQILQPGLTLQLFPWDSNDSHANLVIKIFLKFIDSTIPIVIFLIMIMILITIPILRAIVIIIICPPPLRATKASKLMTLPSAQAFNIPHGG